MSDIQKKLNITTNVSWLSGVTILLRILSNTKMIKIKSKNIFF
jgi:hypothetical protein